MQVSNNKIPKRNEDNFAKSITDSKKHSEVSFFAEKTFTNKGTVEKSENVMSPRSLFLKRQPFECLFPKRVEGSKNDRKKSHVRSRRDEQRERPFKCFEADLVESKKEFIYSCRNDKSNKKKLNEEKKSKNNIDKKESTLTNEVEDKLLSESKILSVKKCCSFIPQTTKQRKNLISETVLENCNQLATVIDSSSNLNHLNILENAQNCVYVKTLGVILENSNSEACHLLLSKTDSLHNHLHSFDLADHHNLSTNANLLDVSTSSLVFPSYQPILCCYENKDILIPLGCNHALYETGHERCVERFNSYLYQSCCSLYCDKCISPTSRQNKCCAAPQDCINSMKAKTPGPFVQIMLHNSIPEKSGPPKIFNALRDIDESNTVKDPPKASDVPKCPFLTENTNKQIISSLNESKLVNDEKQNLKYAGSKNVFTFSNLSHSLISNKKNLPCYESSYDSKTSVTNVKELGQLTKDDHSEKQLSKETDLFFDNKNASSFHLREAIKKEFLLRTLKEEDSKDFKRNSLFNDSSTKWNENLEQPNLRSVPIRDSVLFENLKNGLSTTENTNFTLSEKNKLNSKKLTPIANQQPIFLGKQRLLPNPKNLSANVSNAKSDGLLREKSTSKYSRSSVSELVISMIQRVLQQENLLTISKISSSSSSVIEPRAQSLQKKDYAASFSSSITRAINNKEDSPSNGTAFQISPINNNLRILDVRKLDTNETVSSSPNIKFKPDTRRYYKILRRGDEFSSSCVNPDTNLNSSKSPRNIWFQKASFFQNDTNKLPEVSCKLPTPPSKIYIDTATIFSKNSTKQSLLNNSKRKEKRLRNTEVVPNHAFFDFKQANYYAKTTNWIIPLNSFQLASLVQKNYEKEAKSPSMSNRQNKSSCTFRDKVFQAFRRTRYRGPQAVLYDVKHHNFMSANEKLFVLKKMMYHMAGSEPVFSVAKAVSSQHPVPLDNERRQSVLGEEDEISYLENQTDHGLSSEITRFGRTGYSNVRLPRTSIHVEKISKNKGFRSSPMEDIMVGSHKNSTLKEISYNNDLSKDQTQQSSLSFTQTTTEDFEEKTTIQNVKENFEKTIIINSYNKENGEILKSAYNDRFDKKYHGCSAINNQSFQGNSNDVYSNNDKYFNLSEEEKTELDLDGNETNLNFLPMPEKSKKKNLFDKKHATMYPKAAEIMRFNTDLSDENSNINVSSKKNLDINLKKPEKTAVDNEEIISVILSETENMNRPYLYEENTTCFPMIDSIETEVKETRSLYEQFSLNLRPKKQLPITILYLHQLLMSNFFLNKQYKDTEVVKEVLCGTKNEDILEFIQKQEKLILRSLEILYSLMVQLCDVEWDLKANYPPKQYFVLRQLGLDRDECLSELFFWTTGMQVSECFISKYLSDQTVLKKGSLKAEAEIENIIKFLNSFASNTNDSIIVEKEKIVSSVFSSILVIFFFLHYNKGQRLLYRLLLIIPWSAALILASLILIVLLKINVVSSSNYQNNLKELKNVVRVTLFKIIQLSPELLETLNEQQCIPLIDENPKIMLKPNELITEKHVLHNSFGNNKSISDQAVFDEEIHKNQENDKSDFTKGFKLYFPSTSKSSTYTKYTHSDNDFIINYINLSLAPNVDLHHNNIDILTKIRCNMCMVFGVGDVVENDSEFAKNKKSKLFSYNSCNHKPFVILVTKLVNSLQVLD